MRIVAALGGNALIRRGEPMTAQTRRDQLLVVAQALATLAREHQLVITHGDGPQAGLLALQAAAYAAKDADTATPLELLGADSVGMFGELIEQALTELLPGRRVTTLLTQVEVDPADPSFTAPARAIGPLYGAEQVVRLRQATHWLFARDGTHWRHVVPAPRPQRVLETELIGLLLEQGVTVVCGGGIPVQQRDGLFVSVEAVIDRDHASGLLARQLGADVLLFLTDVPGVAHDCGELSAQWLGNETPASLAALRLAPGSMGPKVRAAVDFVEATGRRAAIGRVDQAAALALGEAGTQVRPDAHVEPVCAP